MPSAPASVRGNRPQLPRRGNTAPVPAGRTEQVRTAALELFAAQGYRATTVDEIGARVGIRGPSVYKHFRSKQELLVDIVVGTTGALLAAQRAAVRSSGDVREQLHRAVEAHVRFHAEHPREAFVAGREVGSLAEPHRSDVLRKQAEYERRLRRLVETGVRDGVFAVESPRLAAYALLDMGTGVAGWFRPGGPVTQDEVATLYADLALRLVGARRSARRARRPAG
jgi:AcrR family transcriptional regulator